MKNPQCHIAYMESHGLSREMLEAMPCRFPGIDPHCLRRLNQSGILHKMKRDGCNVATWEPGAHFPQIMEAWK